MQMKPNIHIIALLMLLASCGGRSDKNTSSVDTTQMMVLQIQQCSRLYTTQVQMRKIITLDDTKTLEASLFSHKFSFKMPGGNRKIAIPIDATAKAYIDFAEFSADNVRRHGGKLEITLPDPAIELTATRIDHEGIMKYVGLVRRDFSDEEMTSLQRRGRDTIVSELPHLKLDDVAKANATRVLVPMLTRMGYDEKDITITFRHDYTPEMLLRTITEPEQTRK